jgi:hypothetical protein
VAGALGFLTAFVASLALAHTVNTPSPSADGAWFGIVTKAVSQPALGLIGAIVFAGLTETFRILLSTR